MSRAVAHPLPGDLETEAAARLVGDLFEEHGSRIYGLCRLLLRSGVEAEDAAQQTFLSAYRSILSGHTPREPAVWLSAIARNECRARIRARMVEPIAFPEVPEGNGGDLEGLAGQRAEFAELCDALSELSDLQREAIVLREFYGLSYDEVAEASGIGAPAVKSVIFRARRRLQGRLVHLRRASAALTLPLALRDSLAQALPNLAGAGGESAGAVAKVASVSLVAKLATATATVALVGSIGGGGPLPDRHGAVAPAKPPPSTGAAERSRAEPARDADKLIVRAAPTAVPDPAKDANRTNAEKAETEAEAEAEAEQEAAEPAEAEGFEPAESSTSEGEREHEASEREGRERPERE